MFSVGASIEEPSQTLVIRELSLFKRFSIPSSACVDPLAWWWMHEGQFFNVTFLAIFFLGIPSS
jgi:hypothetical protein